MERFAVQPTSKLGCIIGGWHRQRRGTLSLPLLAHPVPFLPTSHLPPRLLLMVHAVRLSPTVTQIVPTTSPPAQISTPTSGQGPGGMPGSHPPPSPSPQVSVAQWVPSVCERSVCGKCAVRPPSSASVRATGAGAGARRRARRVCSYSRTSAGFQHRVALARTTAFLTQCCVYRYQITGHALHQHATHHPQTLLCQSSCSHTQPNPTTPTPSHHDPRHGTVGTVSLACTLESPTPPPPPLASPHPGVAGTVHMSPLGGADPEAVRGGWEALERGQWWG